ncbi:MAG: hypothetical protein WCV84_05720 [Patescibacteria group bacterium]
MFHDILTKAYAQPLLVGVIGALFTASTVAGTAMTTQTMAREEVRADRLAQDMPQPPMPPAYPLNGDDRPNEPRRMEGEDFRPPQNMLPTSEDRTRPFPDERRTYASGTEPAGFIPQPDDRKMDGYPGMNPDANRRMEQDREAGEAEMQKRQEEQEKRQEEQEKRQAEQEKRDVANRKREIASINKHLTTLKKALAKFVAKGAIKPTECAEAETSSAAILAAADKATTRDELDDAGMEDLQDHFQTLEDCRRTMERLAQLPRILKQVNTEITKVEREWTRAIKNAPENAADAVRDGSDTLAQVKTSRDAIQTLAKEGKLDDIEIILEDDIYGRLDDIRSSIQRVSAAKNATQFVRTYATIIREAERTIKKLKAQKEDTTRLEEILAESKAKFAAIKAMKSGSEEYLDAVQELAELGQEFADEMGGTEDFGLSDKAPLQMQQPLKPLMP